MGDLQQIWHYFHGRFVVFFSLALNDHINGLNVFGYHIFNLAVHLVSAILVWWLVRLTLSTPMMKEDRINQQADLIALFAGLVFVSHPLQTEAVTYIWQRAASMVALFYLASLCFYIKGRLAGDSVMAKSFYMGALTAAILAMFTKENAVTLPLMVLLYEFTFLKPKKGFVWKYVLPFLLTIFIIPVTFLFIRSQTFQSMHGDLRLHGEIITPSHYFLTQFRAMFTYIRLIFLPVHQNIDYDYPVFKSILEWPVLISLSFLMAILWGAKCLFLKYRLVSFSIFWFFLTLIIPESSFWAMGDLVLEHRLYLPLVGYSMFLVSGLYYLGGKNSVRMMVIALTIVVVSNSVLTYQRNKVWKDEFTLWSDAVARSPDKARPHYNRGLEYYRQGALSQAISDLTKAIEIDPGYADAYTNRGRIYAQQGGFKPALNDFNKAIEVGPNSVVAYSNRGIIYAYYGHFNEAIFNFAQAIKIDPTYGESYWNLAIAYYHLRKYDMAWLNVRKSQELGFSGNPQFIKDLKGLSSPNALIGDPQQN